MKPLLVLLFSCSLLTGLSAQSFSTADSIRGGLTAERVWWDLNYYHLKVDVDIEGQAISGTNEVRFTATQAGQRLQIDLQEPMKLELATYAGQQLKLTHLGNAHYVDLPYQLSAGERASVLLHFSGSPVVAENPPWDGGLTWKKDSNGKPWVANANQGIGASIWWPVKDHPADEVDSMDISVTVPEGLMDVSNGQLSSQETKNGKTTFHWTVKNPINDYGVNLSVGDYISWEEEYPGEAGPLNMSYYVLRENESRAKEHFRDARRMMEAFEHWFGPYPFYEDGFKLVEVPYLGMEHQSSVTYGNKYRQGYLGRDLSGTGEGLRFDFIIIHEAGHEWFANNITNADVADMWIHEGFTAYSENLFLDYHYGKENARKYVIGTRRLIMNDRPIQSPNRGVAHEGSGDMYYKGANILHTLRTIIDDDDKWRTILRGLNADFRHQTVTSDQVFDYIARRTTTDNFAPLPFFTSYVQGTEIPTLIYRLKKGKLTYHWSKVATGFKMPVDIIVDGEEMRIYPTEQEQTLKVGKSAADIQVVEDFYVRLAKGA